jgi:hypothetical protein
MPRGLIDYGEEELGMATSGFLRVSEEQEQIDMANKELAAQRVMQQNQMSATGTGVGAVGGYMAGAAYGAEMGEFAGPIGAVVGAGLGFLFSKLF